MTLFLFHLIKILILLIMLGINLLMKFQDVMINFNKLNMIKTDQMTFMQVETP